MYCSLPATALRLWVAGCTGTQQVEAQIALGAQHGAQTTPAAQAQPDLPWLRYDGIFPTPNQYIDPLENALDFDKYIMVSNCIDASAMSQDVFLPMAHIYMSARG